MMSAMVDLLIDEQHAAIDAALMTECIELDAAQTDAYAVASLIRLHTTHGVIDVGIGPFKVWYAERRAGLRNLFGVEQKADGYAGALALMTAAIRNGAGVVTISRGRGFEWTQEVWAKKAEVS